MRNQSSGSVRAVKGGGTFDPSVEPPIPLGDVFTIPWFRDYLKARAASKRQGRLKKRYKRPDLSTIYRWHRPGLNGVRLETLRVGGTICTSEAALKRFFQRLSEADEARLGDDVADENNHSVDAAEAEMEAAGV